MRLFEKKKKSSHISESIIDNVTSLATALTTINFETSIVNRFNPTEPKKKEIKKKDHKFTRASNSSIKSIVNQFEGICNENKENIPHVTGKRQKKIKRKEIKKEAIKISSTASIGNIVNRFEGINNKEQKQRHTDGTKWTSRAPEVTTPIPIKYVSIPKISKYNTKINPVYSSLNDLPDGAHSTRSLSPVREPRNDFNRSKSMDNLDENFTQRYNYIKHVSRHSIPLENTKNMRIQQKRTNQISQPPRTSQPGFGHSSSANLEKHNFQDNKRHCTNTNHRIDLKAPRPQSSLHPGPHKISRRCSFSVREIFWKNFNRQHNINKDKNLQRLFHPILKRSTSYESVFQSYPDDEVAGDHVTKKDVCCEMFISKEDPNEFFVYIDVWPFTAKEVAVALRRGNLHINARDRNKKTSEIKECFPMPFGVQKSDIHPIVNSYGFLMIRNSARRNK